MGDPQRFQILPFPADIRATGKTLHVLLAFGNYFATNSSCLHIHDINFQILLLLINYLSMMVGGEYTYREKPLSATIITTISANCQAGYDKKHSFIKQGW